MYACCDYDDAGNDAMIRSPLAILAAFLTGSDTPNRRPPSPVTR